MASPLDTTTLATRAVWAGEAFDASTFEHATQVPLVRSASFGYPDYDEWIAVARGERPGHNYSRNTNPTVACLEEKVRALEGAEAALAFASGMGAVSNTLFALLDPGDRVVSIKDSYGGTSRLFLDFLPRIGIQVTLCETTDHDRIEAEVAKGCRVLYLETPTNPTLKVVDIERLARAGHRVGAVVVVDNTFSTPINCNPLELGADLVVHSGTKFLNGHEDAMGGLLAGSKALVTQVYHYREITGAALAPDAAYLILRGMKTLAIRVERQNTTALAVARFLRARSDIEAIHYPGLEDNPGFAIAKRQMRGFGGLVSFQVQGGMDGVRIFLGNLRLACCAPSLGSVQTFVGPPETTSHVECTPEQREALGIPPGLLRYSVGIEDPADLIADLDQALAAVRRGVGAPSKA